MKSLSSQKSREAMSLAWLLRTKENQSKSESLRQAWKNVNLAHAMRKGIVSFRFTKADGTIREAIGTLSPSILPPTGGTGKRRNDMIQAYYDIEKRAYRSFRRVSLIGMTA